MRELILKPRLKQNHNNLKASWYSVKDSSDFNVEEIAEEIALGTKIDFDFSYDGKYKAKFVPYDILFNLIVALEMKKPEIDTTLTRRILLNGGIINYIKKLENKHGVQKCKKQNT